MADSDWHNHITVNGNICHGKACITGTRVMVSIILDNLAENYSFEDILENYPGITKQDIMAAIKYASALSQERTVVIA